MAKVKIIFENSADFFGRIIVYSLDILGEKAFMTIFQPLPERGNDPWVKYRTRDGVVALGKHVICTANSSADVNEAFFGMGRFQESVRQSLFVTQREEAWCGV